MLWMIPLTGIVYAYSWSVQSLSNYIYQQTAKPFLAQSGFYTHKSPTINKSLIEYSVLKVPAVKTTAAKK